MSTTHTDPLDELRRECGYDPDEDGPVDALIGYKDALEDAYAAVLDRLERAATACSWARTALDDPGAIDPDDETLTACEETAAVLHGRDWDSPNALTLFAIAQLDAAIGDLYHEED